MTRWLLGMYYPKIKKNHLHTTIIYADENPKSKLSERATDNKHVRYLGL
jgi:hypothetical protein